MRKYGLFSILVVSLLSLFLGGCSSAPKPKMLLSPKEAKMAEKGLAEKYKQFLEDVVPIMSAAEKDKFLFFKEDFEREVFIEKFWLARSELDEGGHFDYRSIYYARLAEVREAIETPTFDTSRWWRLTFYNLKSIEQQRNPAVIYLLNGPPTEAKRIECEGRIWPIQVWYYSYLPSLHQKDVVLMFVKFGGFEYQLWLPRDGPNSLLVEQSFGSYQMGTGFSAKDLENLQKCFEWRDVLQAMTLEIGTFGDAFNADVQAVKLIAPPAADTAGEDSMVKFSTSLNSSAILLGAKQAGVTFSAGANINKVTVDVSFLVPNAELKARDIGGNSFYNLDVALNVVQAGKEAEKKAFRFDFSVKDSAVELPITVSVDLYPGKYRAIVKIVDANNEQKQSRSDNDVIVPEVRELKEFVVQAVAANQIVNNSAVPSDTDKVQPESRQDTKDGEPKTKGKIKPVAVLLENKQFFIGLNRFEVLTSEEVASVEFQVDGGTSVVKTKKPFSVDFDLGPNPRKHSILVIGKDKLGTEVDRDEVFLNQGAHSAVLKIVKPVENKVHDDVAVQVAITLAGQQKIGKVDFFVNDILSGSRTSEPWTRTVNIPPGDDISIIRVVATFDDGTFAGEDLKYVNYKDFIANVEVKPVELYAVVSDGHQIIEGLGPNSLNVSEDGAPQKIDTLEYAKDSPISVGIAIDTSASMDKSLLEVIKAAIGFIDNVFKPQDRGFTMGFDDTPYMLSQVTVDKDKLKLSISNLRARGLTAFYDTIVIGLYELQDVKGKKALVILTDGRDEGIQVPGQPFRRKSVYDFGMVKIYAERAGITIYPIGFRVKDPEIKKQLNELASVSGGRAYYVDSASDLSGVYKEISSELHSQYVITYYSLSKRKDWRSVTVKSKDGYKVRATPGYYPQ